MMLRTVTSLAPVESSLDFPLSDTGNAEFFEREADHRLAYDHTARQWYEFHGHHWRPDTVQHIVERAVETIRQRSRDAALVTDPDFRKRALLWAVKSEDRRRITDMLTLAQSKRSIAVDGT